MRRLFLILFCLSMFSLQAGCATAPVDSPYLSDDQRARIRTLTVSAVQTLPEVDLSEVEDSPLLRTTEIAVGIFSLVACLTPLTLPACLTSPAVLAPFAGAAAVVEGTEATFKDLPKTLESARVYMKAALERADTQEMLRNRVSDYAKSYIGENALIPISAVALARSEHGRTSKADAMLEVGLRRIKLRKSGSADITLEITAQAKLKETASGAVLLEAEYRYLSDARTPQTWLGDTQRPISRALIDGINSIAQYIADETVLLSKSSLSVLKSERPPDFPDSLAPLYPPGPGRVYVYGQGTLARTPRPFVQIDSLQPTLRWEAARPQVAPEQTQNADYPSVVYDLQVFQAREGKAFFKDGWFPGDLIIKRENLAEPRFEIEAPLKLCAKYFWTVRAKWETSGRLTASEWMATYPYEWGKWHSRPWQLRRNPAPTPPFIVTPVGMSGALANSFLPFQTPCDKPQPENRGRRFNPI